MKRQTAAEAAFLALTPAQRSRLLVKVFEILEYDEDGNPGSEWSSDTTQALGEAFGRYGVAFTDPNSVQAGDHWPDVVEFSTYCFCPTPVLDADYKCKKCGVVWS